MHTLCIKVMFIWKIKLRIASHLFAHLLPDMMVHHTKFLKMLKKQHFLEFRDICISLKYIVVIYPIHTLQSKSLTGSVSVSCDQMQWLHTLTLGRARNSFQVRFCDVFATSLWENCNFFQKKLNLGTLKMTYLCVFRCQLFISFLHVWAQWAVGLSISATAPTSNVCMHSKSFVKGAHGQISVGIKILSHARSEYGDC